MAAGRDMRARLVLFVQDNISPAIGALQRRLNGLANLSRRIGIVGGALAGLSLAGPLHQAAAYDTQLRDLANTQGQTGAAAEAFVTRQGRAVERLALKYRLLSSDLMAANNLMAANALEDQDREKLLPIIAKVSQAERMVAEDTAKLGVSFIQAFRIPADQAELAFAKMIQAGRLGSVELRDMAAGFPALATAAAGVGMTGMKALEQLGAALEIAKRGAPDAATAINNLRNVFAKMTSEETVKNFKEFGVDLPGLLKDAEKKGISAFDALIQKMREKVGNDPFKLSKLFSDMQVVEGLRPILQFTQEMLTMREKIAVADTQIIDQSLEVRFKGLEAQMTGFEEATKQLGRRFGTSLAPGLSMVNQGLIWLIETYDRLHDAYPGLVDGVLLTVGTFAALTAVLAVAGPVIGVVSGAIGLLASPFALAIVAVAALAIGAWQLVRNWKAVSEWFGTLGARLKQGFGPQVAWLRDTVVGVYRAAAAKVSEAWDGLKSFFSGLWQGIKDRFAGFVSWVDGWSGGAATTAIETIKAAWGRLTGWFDQLWKGIEERFDRFIGPITRSLKPLFDLMNQPAPAAPGSPGNPAPAQGQANRRFGARSAVGGFYPPEAAAPAAAGGGPGKVELDGRLQIALAPGLVLRQAETTGGNVAITGDRGRMLGRE